MFPAPPWIIKVGLNVASAGAVIAGYRMQWRLVVWCGGKRAEITLQVSKVTLHPILIKVQVRILL
jgi:hypothetical protein